MFDVLSTLVLAAHLVAVNLASAGPLVCLWLHYRFSRRDEAAGRAGRTLAGLSLMGLAGGSLLGAASLALIWLSSDERYLAAMALFPAQKYWYALAEWLFSLVLLAVYWATWDRLRGRTYAHGAISLLATTNLLYHFPPLLGAIAAASADPALGRELAATTTIAWLRDPLVGSLVVHVWLASFAVAGIGLMLVAAVQDRNEPSQPAAGRIAAWGARVALAASLAQVAVGVWLMVSLPASVQYALLGEDLAATAMFGVSIVATLALLHYLAAASLGDAERRTIVRSALLMLLVIVLMTGALRAGRSAAQSEHLAQSPGARYQPASHSANSALGPAWYKLEAQASESPQGIHSLALRACMRLPIW